MANDQPGVDKEFLASFKGFLARVNAQPVEEEPDPALLRRLRAHFNADPTGLPIVEEQFQKSEHPNLHLALTEYLAADGRSCELLGVSTPNDHMGVKLAHLTQRQPPGWAKAEIAPVTYVNIPLNDDHVLACVQSGLYLVRDGTTPLAIVVRGPREMGWGQTIDVEVMGQERDTAEHFLAALRTAMRVRNVYRGHVISLTFDQHALAVKFHRLPTIAREDIILPRGVIERVERQTIGFARHSEKLRAAGRHIKRGLLLYGPPGTGKTLTAMYLAAQMPDRTVILLTGRSVGLLEQSCTLARILQPATVILEDVDLIAEERTQQSAGCNALLFELLNQMDGLADDADILFLLTTNRPEILEPALAARPGRVDQAMEIPLPDSTCRTRLFELYGQGLDLRIANLERLVERTKGVSAAFIRELMRKAALYAADERPELVVEDRHVEEALSELVLEGGDLTKRLLGAGKAFYTAN